MALNWIDVKDFSFNCLMLMERFQLRLLFDASDEAALRDLGVALRYNPAALWVAARRCPERAEAMRALAERAEAGLSPDDVRGAELRVMASVEDFVLYTRPEWMDSHCDFIYAWNPERLYELADFADQVVLDVGSGSGRLAFAVADRARFVVASEPVGTLRAYLRDRASREGKTNLRVADGMADQLPFPDSCFDIVMSGHVVGDDYDAEIAELTRVCKPGGWLLDCPGEDSRPRASDGELSRRGWECFHYKSALGGDVYRYRTRVVK